MSKQNDWTPEPWVTDGAKVEGNSPGAMHDIAICPTYAHFDWTGGDNARRIAACVNSCGGYSLIDGRWVKTHERLTNPDKEIKALREVAEAGCTIENDLIGIADKRDRGPFTLIETWRLEAMFKALAALKAEGEGKNA